MDKLSDPVDHSRLVMDVENHELRSPDHPEQPYPVEGNLAILLPRQVEKAQRNAEQHEKAGTTFLYADHYQKDAEYFDYFEGFEDPAARHENRRLHEAILSEVPTRVETILDAGCGNAWLARELCPKGFNVVSMDISDRNVSEAVKRYPHPQHFGVVADLYALPFRDNAFEAVISAEVMEHVPDVKQYLNNLIRVARPGGKVIISTPYNEKIAYNLCIHCNQPTPQHAHLHTFTEKSIDALTREIEGISTIAYTFSNKALARLRTHVILQHAPFWLWQKTDRWANKLYKKPGRMLVVLSKKN
jgi:2-polyprenyl-3-methyl-5-hydroxy-6-metoxy-1,4-benzoquinol methylase